MGKVEDRHSVGGRGRKRVFQEMLFARNVRAWGCPFFEGEDTCQQYAKGHQCCGPLRAGKRTKCSGQALNCLGVLFLNGEEV